MERFDALIIHPDTEIRATIKELLHNEQSFGYTVYRKVYVVESLAAASASLSETASFDIIYISNRFELADVGAFITKSKERQADAGVAYIGILDADEHVKTKVAQGLACGQDGFLVFPCSIDNLRDITALANRIKKQAHAKMLQAALRMLVRAVTAEIDKRVDEFYHTGKLPIVSKQSKGATLRMVQDDDESRSQFYEILMEVAADALPRIAGDDKCTWAKYRARDRRKIRDATSLTTSDT